MCVSHFYVIFWKVVFLSSSKDILKHLLLSLGKSQESDSLGNFFFFCDSLDFWLQEKPALHLLKIYFKGWFP